MSEVINIDVPQGKRYISDWKSFKLNDHPHILDKQIPGCGFTQWCLTNTEDVVLCSPRKILLKNKQDQFSKDVFYLQNDFENEVTLDKDISPGGLKEKSTIGTLPSNNLVEKEKAYKKLRKDLETYLQFRADQGKPRKVLVTYDSFHLVKDILSSRGELWGFQVVVDEWQSIFIDSRFKGSTEIKFLSELRNIVKVCFVSATPMIDKYLQLLDEFREMPYYRLNWSSLDPSRVRKPDLKVRISKSVYTTAKKIIDSYKLGNFAHKYIKDPVTGEVKRVESREAVLYVNSVNNILSIIKKSNLTPLEVNILCADTSENRNKIKKKLGTKFSIGEVPLKGQPHKMFTFCTRTVYLGADFCSTCARTFIISDANIESLAVDISLDLPQIMGRQRLDENPWKNSAEFYYKPILGKNYVSKAEFDQRVKEKLEKTKYLLDSYRAANAVSSANGLSLLEVLERDARLTNYRYNYLAVNFENGSLVPVINKLVMVAEQRAFDIQQVDYADRFMVFNTLTSDLIDNSSCEATKFMAEYEQKPNAYEKLKFLCSSTLSPEFMETVLMNIKEHHFAEYYRVLGPDKIRSSGYNITKLNREMNSVSFDPSILDAAIYSEFTVGSRITLADIKVKLRDIYDRCSCGKSPKATDLCGWFEVKLVCIPVGDGKKRVQGYEILSRK